MKILAMDTSSKAASAAVWADGRLLGEYYTNTGLTHSQTLLPMVQHLLQGCGFTADEMDAIAVTAGPGSFTGLRIGLSAAKGIAFASGAACLPVSTLEVLASGLLATDGILCPAMDARCQQVYTAIFRCRRGELTRLMEDSAIPLSELQERLAAYDEPITLVGDGALLCQRTFGDALPDLRVAPDHLLHQHAAPMAVLAAQKLARGEGVSAAALEPVYLRLPQAERELKQRQAEKGI